MNLPTALILIFLIVIVALVVRHMILSRKNGSPCGGCSGGCGACGGCTPVNRTQKKTNN